MTNNSKNRVAGPARPSSHVVQQSTRAPLGADHKHGATPASTPGPTGHNEPVPSWSDLYRSSFAATTVSDGVLIEHSSDPSQVKIVASAHQHSNLLIDAALKQLEQAQKKFDIIAPGTTEFGDQEMGQPAARLTDMHVCPMATGVVHARGPTDCGARRADRFDPRAAGSACATWPFASARPT
jgi:hypothetical protein